MSAVEGPDVEAAPTEASFVVTSPQQTFAPATAPATGGGYALPCAAPGMASAVGGRDVASPPSPRHHPRLPESLWVLDPMTRKLKVPTHLIVPTAATASVGSTPSLCLAFIENRCRHSWCRQAHVPLQVVKKLRQDAQSAPTCCYAHRAPQEPSCLRARFVKIEVVFPGVTRVLIDATNVAVTVGLQRHLAQVVPASKQGPVLDVPSRMVCRLHLANRCRYLEDCNNLHLCREHDGLRRALADCGHPAPTPSTPQTPAATAATAARHPSPLQPPAYVASPAAAAPSVDRSLSPFVTPLPPSALSNSAVSMATPGLPQPTLQGVVPGAQQAVIAGRVYKVTTLRCGAVTDAEMAAVVDVQRGLHSKGSHAVEVIDLPPPPPCCAPPPYGITAASLEAACCNTAMVSALGGGSATRTEARSPAAAAAATAAAWADATARYDSGECKPRPSAAAAAKGSPPSTASGERSPGPLGTSFRGMIASILDENSDDDPPASAADRAAANISGDAWAIPPVLSGDDELSPS